MGIETLLTAGASLGGALLSSGAASDGVDAQVAASDRASARQDRQYDQTRQDYAPYRAAGSSALAKLSDLLGLTTPGASGSGRTEQQIRASLTPQFTTGGSAGTPGTPAGYSPQGSFVNGFTGVGQGDGPAWMPATPGTAGTPGVVDTAGLDAAAQRELAGQQPGPNTGSLLKPFTGADLANEPGYQFGLSEGLKGQENSLAARGMALSGAALKGANRFATDYASTKYGDAYNRDAADKSRTFGMLSGVAGTGQTATNQVSAAGQNTANQVSGNLIGAGDARASGYLANGNIWGNAINQGVSAWKNSPGMSDPYARNNAWTGKQYGYASDNLYGG